MLSDAVRWGGIGWLGYCAWQAVASLAGQQTDASIAIMIDFFSRSHGIVTGAALVFGIAGVGYGYVQRSQRRRTVESMQHHVRELEVQIDPSRTSSGLTTRGDTNPEDR